MLLRDAGILAVILTGPDLFRNTHKRLTTAFCLLDATHVAGMFLHRLSEICFILFILSCLAYLTRLPLLAIAGHCSSVTGYGKDPHIGIWRALGLSPFFALQRKPAEKLGVDWYWAITTAITSSSGPTFSLFSSIFPVSSRILLPW